MRCLYCGKQLPLLKKLTGGGEFCSEAHRQKYQEEYNKLALSRLLQTQNPESDGAARGELVLASRHPALQAGRTPLRALEAPKSVEPPPPPSPLSRDVTKPDAGLEPVSNNWSPGANRLQRSLPPPAALRTQGGGGLGDAPPSIADRAFPKPFDRQSNSSAQDPQNQDFTSDIKKKALPKRDAFSFRPMEPFPAETPKPAPPPTPSPVAAAPAPPPVEPAAPAAPTAAAAPTALTRQPAHFPERREHDRREGDRRGQPKDPPQAPFILVSVKLSDPPPFRKTEASGGVDFTSGKPPADGWARWEPDIQGGPGGGLESRNLLPLTAPPGASGGGGGGGEGGSAENLAEKENQESSEIRKRILENQVKPGEFQQTAPKAPEGLTPVLPIRAPAAALDGVAVTVKAKAPEGTPLLYLATVANGEDLWTGWTMTGLARVRMALTLVAPEPVDEAPEALEAGATPLPVPVPEPIDTAVSAPALTVAVPLAPAPAPPAATNGTSKLTSATTAAPPPAAKPVVEPSRNYKAAEALKSAAQAVVAETAAAQPPTPQPVKTSTPRHEVFVDLSVLGIEEDEDADAEFVAREGESPPGRRRRKFVDPREAVRELVSATPPPAAPAAPLLAPVFPAQSWEQTAIAPVRLSSEPLRPKVVFESRREEPVAPKAAAPKSIVPKISAPEAKDSKGPVKDKVVAVSAPVALPIDPGNMPHRALAVKPPSSSSLASAWSAKRLNKIEAGTPQAPASSGALEAPVETPVAEVPVPQAAEPAKVAAPEAPVVAAPTPVKPIEESAKPQEQRPPGLTKSSKFLTLDKEAVRKALDSKPAAVAEASPAPLKPEAKQDSIPDTNKEGGSRKARREREREAAKSAAADKDSKKTTINAAKLPVPEPLPEVAPFEAPILGAGSVNQGSLWANMPILPKLAIGLSLVAAIAGGIWMNVKPHRNTAAEESASKARQKTVHAGSSLMMNLPGGWNPDWGGEASRKKHRTISFYRPSANHDDYRIEFDGQIDAKGLGWVFRAADPNNYYACKIELVKTGAAGAALSRFSVVNGVESQKQFTPLPKPIHLGASFHVRLDVRGEEFSAYLNGDLIDVWTDSRIQKGGLGLMTEPGESGFERNVQIFELVP